MKKIAITGTKGKTTVSNVLAAVLRSVEPLVLNVDTNGAYVNGELKISKQQSQQIWDVVPTVAPGRFLYLLAPDTPIDKEVHHGNLPGIAVLEASLGCGTNSGLGYYGHDIGIFTNVFEDHLGSRPDLTTRADIGKSKRFIFARVNRDGSAVFNADDDIVCKELAHCKDGVEFIPFGLNFAHFDLETHLAGNGYALTVEDGWVALLHGSEKERLIDVSAVVWTFSGKYMPSVYNLLAVVGALFVLYEHNLPSHVKEALTAVRLDPYSGRLTLLKNEAGVTILADYAHEKQSLHSIAELAHNLKAPDGKVIGVLRLSWDRTEELVRETAQHIAHDYDQFVIYDKIDGHFRQPSSRFRTGQRQFTQEVGKISNWFADELQKDRGEEAVTRILREDQALQAAAGLSRPGDVVVCIVNDDIKQSIGFISEAFGAKLA